MYFAASGNKRRFKVILALLAAAVMLVAAACAGNGDGDPGNGLGGNGDTETGLPEGVASKGAVESHEGGTANLEDWRSLARAPEGFPWPVPEDAEITQSDRAVFDHGTQWWVQFTSPMDLDELFEFYEEAAEEQGLEYIVREAEEELEDGTVLRIKALSFSSRSLVYSVQNIIQIEEETDGTNTVWIDFSASE